MKNLTSKRQALQREYRKVILRITEERENCCEGCGLNRPLTPSHRIAKSRNINLLAVPANIDLYCHECHMKYESGKLWELNNEDDVLEFLKDNDLELYQKKKDKSRVSIVFQDFASKNIKNLSARLKEIGKDSKYLKELENDGLIFKINGLSEIHYQRAI